MVPAVFAAVGPDWSASSEPAWQFNLTIQSTPNILEHRRTAQVAAWCAQPCTSIINKDRELPYFDSTQHPCQREGGRKQTLLMIGSVGELCSTLM
jgi:hypothetical protein